MARAHVVLADEVLEAIHERGHGLTFRRPQTVFDLGDIDARDAEVVSLAKQGQQVAARGLMTPEVSDEHGGIDEMTTHVLRIDRRCLVTQAAVVRRSRQ